MKWNDSRHFKLTYTQIDEIQVSFFFSQFTSKNAWPQVLNASLKQIAWFYTLPHKALFKMTLHKKYS